MVAARVAGLLLLLTAVATAVAVAARLAGSAEPPEGSPLYLPVVLDTGLYVLAGAARAVSGLALLAGAALLRRAMPTATGVAVAVAAALLAISGTVTAVSGACMLALAAGLPETAAAAAYAGPVPGWAEPLNAARSITGKAGFTLAGLGLVALAPAQWRTGGRLKIGAAAGAIIGVAMLFIWVDAATVMHRVSGIAFLLWLIVAGLWLAAGRLRTPAASGTTAASPAYRRT